MLPRHQCQLGVPVPCSRLDSGNPCLAVLAERSNPLLRKGRKRGEHVASQSLFCHFLWHTVCLKLHFSCCCWHSLPHTSVMSIHWQRLEATFGRWNASSVKHYYFSHLMAVYRFLSSECLPKHCSLLAFCMLLSLLWQMCLLQAIFCPVLFLSTSNPCSSCLERRPWNTLPAFKTPFLNGPLCFAIRIL